MNQIDQSHSLDSTSTVRRGGIYFLAVAPFTWTQVNPTHMGDTYSVLLPAGIKLAIRFSIKIKHVFWEVTDFDLLQTIFSPFSKSVPSLSQCVIILTIFRVNNSLFEATQVTFPTVLKTKKIFEIQKQIIDKSGLSVSLFKEWGERRKSHLSAGGQNTLHFVLECREMIALDSKWRGIDMIWDFSTIRNNDLFSEATSCQVITCLGWKWTIFWHR